MEYGQRWNCGSRFSERLSAATVCNAGSGRPSLPTVLYIPLTFFYTKNPGAALPLIALQYHEVKLNIQWQDQKFIAGNFTSAASTTPEPLQAAVYVDYIYPRWRSAVVRLSSLTSTSSSRRSTTRTRVFHHTPTVLT